MQSINIERLDDINYRSTEAYNTLRTNIQFCGKDIKSICITSCTPNEGKSLVSFRLANSLAESGKKVLFLDADLRKSVLAGRLKIDKGIFGLSQYLSGIHTLEEVLYQTNLENLDVIFSGPTPPNPLDLINKPLFSQLISKQRENYDYIIVDTPPLGIVIDSANIAEVCDGTILVIETNVISYKFAQRVLKQLKKGTCNMLGVVLNKVGLKQRNYYGKRYNKYYGKYYGNYYETYVQEK